MNEMSKQAKELRTSQTGRKYWTQMSKNNQIEPNGQKNMHNWAANF